MRSSKTILLIVALVIIVGAVYYLESQKVSPVSRDSSGDEIRIEDIVTIEGENIEGNGEPIAEAEQAMETNAGGDINTIETTQNNPETTKPATTDTPKQVITQSRADRIAEKSTQYERAKEISTPDGFINTDALTVTELIGEKIVLLDIWTYSCINCQRTLPYLNSWHDKYADDGLVIIGLHTPEFEFEKEYENVKRATEKWGVEYPVVLDNDYSTWRAYNNRYWPRKYLIDIDGFVVYDHIGEGGYLETERKIVELINEKNKVVGLPPIALDTRTPEEIDEVNFNQIKTRESYFGSSRIEYLSNLPNSNCYSVICDFEAPENVPLNQFALGGEWEIETENAVLKDNSGVIISHFSASKVNLVAGSDESVTATVYLDGEIISDAFAGEAVVNGRVIFKEHDLYNLVDLRGDYGEHVLEIRFEDGEIAVFAFTFG